MIIAIQRIGKGRFMTRDDKGKTDIVPRGQVQYWLDMCWDDLDTAIRAKVNDSSLIETIERLEQLIKEDTCQLN